MAASSLLALIDDISTMLDDAAILTKVAASKTAGVMGDDLALNAEQVSGVNVERELPVVWAVAKGSFVNKLILVPAALGISAFIPAAIMPLMMIGGLFLCYEGFEKVAHKLLHDDAEDAAHAKELMHAMADSSVDLVALEKGKVKGAIRTDFVLSAEIIVITLGTMSTAPMAQQIMALSAVAIGATVLVYGLVAGIVKLDDLGLALRRKSAPVSRKLGAAILRTAPLLMKTLSVLGTFAMFSVGGSIIVHGAPIIEHLVESIAEPIAARGKILSTIAIMLLDAITGIVAGGLAVVIVMLGKRLFGAKAKATPAH